MLEKLELIHQLYQAQADTVQLFYPVVEKQKNIYRIIKVQLVWKDFITLSVCIHLHILFGNSVSSSRFDRGTACVVLTLPAPERQRLLPPSECLLK